MGERPQALGGCDGGCEAQMKEIRRISASTLGSTAQARKIKCVSVVIPAG
jgi:hypothetical protein